MRQLRYRFLSIMLGLLSMVALSSVARAQNEPDTAQVQEPPPEVSEDDSSTLNFNDKPALKKSVYFTERQYQSNGGGPGQIQPRALPDSVVSRLKTDKDFWYANYSFKKQKQEEENTHVPLVETALFQTLLWILIIGGFAGCLIVYLSNSNVGLFRNAGQPVASGDEVYVDTDNIFEINYQREIERAAANNNYRLAVRLLFLQTLKNLSNNQIIHYQQDRTNFDYVQQLYSTRYYHDFFGLTRSYEYCWYGHFEIDKKDYGIIKTDFESFDRNLSS